MIINTNVSALFTQRSIHNAESDMNISMERLSSGKRINAAADDAAGLQITERFKAQISGSHTAERNASDAISVVQTAEAAYESVQDMLQRMRELALQSSNGVLNLDDRKSLDQEYQQLTEEIARTSDSTIFNHFKLLDGSYTDRTFQIGANLGDTLSVSLISAHPSDLGASNEATLTAQGNSGALAVGDLEINNVEIGPALEAYDTASYSNKSSSAIAKVAAINAMSEESGVTAQVNTNAVTGSTMVSGATASGSVSLNGTTINLTTTSDLAATRSAMVSAINQYEGETGVTAINTGSDKQGVQLVATDGRNISIAFTGVTSAGTGITQGDHFGSYTLSSDEEITISRGSNDSAASLDNSGLREGTYSTQDATISSVADADTSWARGDVIINGTLIRETRTVDDALSTTNKDQSSIAKAAAINAHSEQTGVTATVDPTRVDGATMAANTATTSGSITINGVATENFSTSGTNEDSRERTIAAINAISDRTGVYAIDTHKDGTGVQLMSEDGRNIVVAAHSGHSSSSTGVSAGTHTGSFTLHSTSEITIDSENATTFNSRNDFENVGSFGMGLTGEAIDRTSITTTESAHRAVASIDNAIEQINEARGDMGAKQNRLEQTVKNLQNMSENMDAARSRIEDANFATESTNLARSKILQQASTAMLAQANQSGQQVMKLLQ